MEKHYNHLCCAERDEIFLLLKDGISRREIAKMLSPLNV
jgi:IS30 family transposase